MSCGEKTEDLDTSVGELTYQMTDTLKCCMRNYEALLPFLGQEETNFKIYHKLVKVNILLSRLNEALVGLRVEYVTVLSHEPEGEAVLSRGWKRRASDLSDAGRHETKSIITEVPFSSSTKCSVTSSSESGVNILSENLESMGTEETRHSQLQSVHTNDVKNIETEIEDSDEVENVLEHLEGNCEFSVTQKSYEVTSNATIVCFDSDEESVSVTVGVVGDTACDKASADTVAQRGNGEECVPLHNVESETSNGEKCEDSGNILSENRAERPVDNKQFSAPLKSSDATNNAVTARFAGDEESASVSDGIVESIAFDKAAADIVTQTENEEECVLVIDTESEFSDEEKSEDNSSVICGDETGRSIDSQESHIAFTTCNKESAILIQDRANDCNTRERTTPNSPIRYEKDDVPVQRSELCSVENKLHGVLNNEECVLLIDVESEFGDEEIHADSSNVVSGDEVERSIGSKESHISLATYNKESAILVQDRANNRSKGERRTPYSPIRYEKDNVPVQSSELRSLEGRLYGVIKLNSKRYKCTYCNYELFGDNAINTHVKGKKHKMKQKIAAKYSDDIRVENERYRCILCNREFFSYWSACSHMKGQKHKRKQISAKGNSCAKDYEVPNISCEKRKKRRRIQTAGNNSKCAKMSEIPNINGGSTKYVSVCSASSCLLPDNIPSHSCESRASISVCPVVSCALADSVAIVEDNRQLITMKQAIRLENIWTYFCAPFHINKKFFRFHSGQLICSLCYEQVGRYIRSVKIHISRSYHLDRMNILRNIELESKSSNKQLLDIPNSLKNIVPTTQFSVTNGGFFCIVCNCFWENAVVLNHMTGKSHIKKLAEMKKRVSTKPTITAV